MSLRSVVLSLCLVVVAAFVVEGPRTAAADELIINRPFSGPRRDIEISPRLNFEYGFGFGFGGCGYYADYGCAFYGGYAVGPGAQVLFPLVKNGFIPSLNNAFYLGFFTDFLYVPYGYYGGGLFSFSFGPMVQWRFYIFNQLSVFSNLGLQFWIFDGGNVYGYDYGTTYSIAPLFEVGGNWHFAKHIALTFSLGYPATRVGVSFGF